MLKNKSTNYNIHNLHNCILKVNLNVNLNGPFKKGPMQEIYIQRD